jgi:hypothetical protein
MHVLYGGTHWLRFWSHLENDDEDKEKVTMACQKLETMAMELFAGHGWRCNNRICA